MKIGEITSYCCLSTSLLYSIGILFLVHSKTPLSKQPLFAALLIGNIALQCTCLATTNLVYSFIRDSDPQKLLAIEGSQSAFLIIKCFLLACYVNCLVEILRLFYVLDRRLSKQKISLIWWFSNLVSLTVGIVVIVQIALWSFNSNGGLILLDWLLIIYQAVIVLYDNLQFFFIFFKIQSLAAQRKLALRKHSSGKALRKSSKFDRTLRRYAINLVLIWCVVFVEVYVYFFIDQETKKYTFMISQIQISVVGNSTPELTSGFLISDIPIVLMDFKTLAFSGTQILKEKARMKEIEDKKANSKEEAGAPAAMGLQLRFVADRTVLLKPGSTPVSRDLPNFNKKANTNAKIGVPTPMVLQLSSERTVLLKSQSSPVSSDLPIQFSPSSSTQNEIYEMKIQGKGDPANKFVDGMQGSASDLHLSWPFMLDTDEETLPHIRDETSNIGSVQQSSFKETP
jgi:hypothetical protein